MMEDRQVSPTRTSEASVCVPKRVCFQPRIHIADTLRASREPALLRASREAQRLPPGARD